MEKTTIQLSQKTLERLKALKKYERESYDNIVNSLIDETEEDLTDEDIEEIELALKEIRKKGIKKATEPIEQVAEELGVKLK